MKFLIIKCAYPMKSDGLKKYEDEFNRMIRENGYLILPPGFETEVVDVDCLDVFVPNEAKVKCDISDCMWNFKGTCSVESTACIRRNRKETK